MTAIGFVFFIIGFPLAHVFHRIGFERAENAAFWMWLTGFTSMVAGIATWLWKVMP